MPEGPELHLAARLVNAACAGLSFAAPVVRSAVSKSAEVGFDSGDFSVSAAARGKEVKVFLQDRSDPAKKSHVLFRFGMSGCFKMSTPEELHKHAHLRFHTNDKTRVLSFVDTRRFGSWHVGADWGAERGPDPMFEYEAFRENVLSNLEDSAFNKAICEVMMNQKFFNGVGNYLRAEILYRLGIRPFDRARDVLDKCKSEDNGTSNGVKVKKEESGDLLETTRDVMLEVINLPGTGYSVEPEPEALTAFTSWLRCYYVAGMKTLPDGNKRTVWFAGDPGPMAPKAAKPTTHRGKIEKGDHVYGKKKEKVEVKKEPPESLPAKPKKTSTKTKTSTSNAKKAAKKQASAKPEKKPARKRSITAKKEEAVNAASPVKRRLRSSKS